MLAVALQGPPYDCGGRPNQRDDDPAKGGWATGGNGPQRLAKRPPRGRCHDRSRESCAAQRNSVQCSAVVQIN